MYFGQIVCKPSGAILTASSSSLHSASSFIREGFFCQFLTYTFLKPLDIPAILK